MPLKKDKDKKQNPDILSLQDLRVIIHGLKMAGFSFLEEDAADMINQMISSLPQPEELASICDSPAGLKKITQFVGEIMRLIEIYGKKDAEYKTRFKSKKGFPPRYKVLEWRKNMNKASTIKEIIKISRATDDKGYSDISGKLVAIAKDIKDNKCDKTKIADVVALMKKSGMEREALFVEAGFMDVMRNVGYAFQGGFANAMYGKLQKAMQQWGKTMQIAQTEAQKMLQQVVNTVNEAAQTRKDPNQQKQFTELAQQIKAYYDQRIGGAINALNQAGEGLSQMVYQGATQIESAGGAAGGEVPTTGGAAGGEVPTTGGAAGGEVPTAEIADINWDTLTQSQKENIINQLKNAGFRVEAPATPAAAPAA